VVDEFVKKSMAEKKCKTVVIAVDSGKHSEYTFDCKSFRIIQVPVLSIGSDNI